MKIGRNDPCPCGSGKKYKKCCLLQAPGATEEKDGPCVANETEEPFGEEALLGRALFTLRRRVLKRKPHIKAYYKLRKLHSEISEAMAQYYQNGRFERYVDKTPIQLRECAIGKGPLQLFQCEFDMNTREGEQAFYDMQIYKVIPNVKCITEAFLEERHYRKEEKIAFLRSMLQSTSGLFEISGVDGNEGYVFLKEVFTGKQYTLTDVSLSGSGNYDTFYMYSRIIEHQGICFFANIAMPFLKTDKFILDHIKQHKEEYSPEGEFFRFAQVYNHFSQSKDAVTVVTNAP